MSDIDLERGLAEFLRHAREAFLEDPSYAEEVARQAATFTGLKAPDRTVD